MAGNGVNPQNDVISRKIEVKLISPLAAHPRGTLLIEGACRQLLGGTRDIGGTGTALSDLVAAEPRAMTLRATNMEWTRLASFSARHSWSNAVPVQCRSLRAISAHCYRHLNWKINSQPCRA